MAVVQELIRTEDNGTISFGDYELNQKSKLSDYQYQGDMYKVKTYKEITVEVEADTEYQVFIDDVSTGTMTTNLGGKLSFSVELDANTKAEVKIVKC